MSVNHAQVSPGFGGVRHTNWLGEMIPVLMLLLVYAALVAWNIRLPGLYMDAVNPDYMVIKYLEPRSVILPEWSVHSLMPSLYHGKQHVWCGLPVYAITGTTIEALRAVHAVFGGGILLCLYIMIRRFAAPSATALVLIPLACDPSFLMAFRTQSYITLGPTVWLLMSMLLVTGKATPSPWRWVASGWAMGWAVYGYFIYGFFVPVIAAVVWKNAKLGRFSARRLSACWLAGFTLGLIFYLVAYLSLIRNHGGLSGFFHYFQQEQAKLGVFSSEMGIINRLVYAFERLWYALSNSWHNALIFQDSEPDAGSRIKLLALSGGALIGMIAPSTRRFAGMLLALSASFVLIGLNFGSRLNSHHYVWAIPFLYAAGGAGLVVLLAHGGVQRILAVCLLVTLVGINLFALNQLHNRLERTGGAGLFSDAITKFAEEAATKLYADHFFFPEWGLFMPFAFLTGGKIPYSIGPDDPALMRALCRHERVILAVPGAHRRTAMLEYATSLNSALGETVTYAQHEGKVVIEAAPITLEPGACPPELRSEVGIASDPDKFRAEPAVIRSCDSSSGKTTLHWHVLEFQHVEVRVGAPDGALFAKGGSQGLQETGKWVKDGMTFYLLNAETQEVIATVSVRVNQDGCW